MNIEIRKDRIGIYLVLILVLMIPFVSTNLAYFALVIGLIRTFRYKLRGFLEDLALLCPFAFIFRLPTGINALTIWCISGLLLITLFKKVTATRTFLLMMTIACYLLLRSNFVFGDYLSVVSGLFLVYCSIGIDNEFYDYEKRILWSFCNGLTISIVYALLFRGSEYLQRFTKGETNAYLDSDLMRFKGLFQDSNYFASFVVVGILVMIIIMRKDSKHRVWQLFCVVTMLYAGAITYSRSFYLCLLLLLIVGIIRLMRHGHYFFALLVICSVGLIIYAVVSDKIPFFYGIMQRFNEDDINSLSSGRTISWKNYIQFLFSHVGSLLIGNGFGYQLINNLGTHNLFLEVVYYIGVVGLVLFSLFLISVIQDIRVKNNGLYKRMKLLPVWVLLLLYFFLQGMFSTSFYIELSIAIVCSRWLCLTNSINYILQDTKS